jgi:hypothetical protein
VSGDTHADGHRMFSSECFNRVWELIDRFDRSDDDTELMIDSAHASRFHWRMRDDVDPRNMAIASWQLSGVYTAAGRSDEALRHGQESLDICMTNSLSPFLSGYAFEALARAALLGGDDEAARRHLEAAKDAATRIEDDEERTILMDDIEAAARAGI